MSSEAVMRPDIVNYKTYPMHNGRYRLRRVPMNNVTGSEVTLQAAATTLVEFKLPAGQVWNPARSSIDYQIEVAGEAAKSIWTFEDTFEICNSIQFCNASGMYLTDLQYANNYVKIARKIDTEKTDFDSLDATSGLYKAADVSKNYFPAVAVMPGDNAYAVDSAAARVTAYTPAEPQYAKGSVTLADDCLRARSIPLSAFTHTALGMDRDMIFGEDMYIRIQLAPSNKVAYTSTSISDPAAGPLAVATQPKIRNLCLQLAFQTDEVLVASVKEKFLTGKMSYLIPFQYGWRNTTAPGLSNIQLQLNNQFGNRLKRLLHIPMVSAEATNKAYDHQNLNGSKIVSYQTFLDSVPLQDSVISCLQPVPGGALGMDDFRINRDLLRGTALENSLAYYFNWHHQDSFSQPKRGKVFVPEENILEGLDLTFPRQWTISATTPVALTHYTFGEFVRQVVATPQGTQILVA